MVYLKIFTLVSDDSLLIVSLERDGNKKNSSRGIKIPVFSGAHVQQNTYYFMFTQAVSMFQAPCRGSKTEFHLFRCDKEKGLAIFLVIVTNEFGAPTIIAECHSSKILCKSANSQFFNIYYKLRGQDQQPLQGISEKIRKVLVILLKKQWKRE